MIYKRYSIPTKTKALNIIKTLKLEKGQTTSKDIHGIIELGFEKKIIPILDADGQPTFDDNGFPLFDIIKGNTFNVDIVWKEEQPLKWKKYEVNPISPSHTIL
jgi:hypothetical protein